MPVVPGFHPDPSVCWFGRRYVMVCSSFEYLPGIPVLVSDDLLVWKQVGNAVTREGQFGPRSAEASSGLFAPTLRCHDGRLHLVTTNVNGNGQHLVLTADDPAGPWSDPVVIAGLPGIDPDLAWDDEDRCLLTWASYAEGRPGLWQAAVDLDSGAVLSEPRLVWAGTGLAHPEAPHLYRIGSWWYLLIAEGGTERGHCVSIARGPTPSGPFSGAPTNPLLSHRSRAAMPQSTGHGDLVQAADGSWAMVYLGVLPRGITPGFHVNGRETFLSRVTWVDGWPVVADRPVDPPPVANGFDDRFDGPTPAPLGPHWVAPGQLPVRFTRHEPGRALMVKPGQDAPTPPLVVRTTGESWRVEAELDLGTDAEAHVLVRIDDRHELRLEVDPLGCRAVLRVGALQQTLGTAQRAPGRRVLAHLASRPCGPGDHGPDVLTVGEGPAATELARVDGRYLSTEVAGGFTGRMVGVRAVAGDVGVRRFGLRTDGS